jgi:hypothetical protein
MMWAFCYADSRRIPEYLSAGENGAKVVVSREEQFSGLRDSVSGEDDVATVGVSVMGE